MSSSSVVAFSRHWRHETTSADHHPGRVRVGRQQAPAAHRRAEAPSPDRQPSRQAHGLMPRRPDRRQRPAAAVGDSDENLTAQLHRNSSETCRQPDGVAGKTPHPAAHRGVRKPSRLCNGPNPQRPLRHGLQSDADRLHRVQAVTNAEPRQQRMRARTYVGALPCLIVPSVMWAWRAVSRAVSLPFPLAVCESTSVQRGHLERAVLLGATDESSARAGRTVTTPTLLRARRQLPLRGGGGHRCPRQKDASVSRDRRGAAGCPLSAGAVVWRNCHSGFVAVSPGSIVLP